MPVHAPPLRLRGRDSTLVIAQLPKDLVPLQNGQPREGLQVAGLLGHKPAAAAMTNHKGA